MIVSAKRVQPIDKTENIIMTRKIMTPIDLVERLQAHYGGVSVYRVAKNLELKNPRVLNWAHGKSCPTPKEAVRIAEILGIDPAFVVASMEAQRQSEPDLAEVWHTIAEKVADDKAA